jgi:low temperature requirement protein LtrA
VVDFVLTYLLAFEGGWQVQSAAHWSERFGLVVILALGESIVSIGVGAAREPISWPILAGTVLAITLSICLWWLYFDIVAIVAEKVLKKLAVGKRSALATDAYTYIHFLLIAGIIISALGIETVIAKAGSGHPLGLFGACALYGGTALYLAGHALFWRRMIGKWRALRLVGGAVLLLLIPVGAALPPLVALVIAVAVTAGVVAIETIRNAEVRAQLRRGEGLETGSAASTSGGQ